MLRAVRHGAVLKDSKLKALALQSVAEKLREYCKANSNSAHQQIIFYKYSL